ncbi:nucleotidyltransferase family protein [Laspinema olomoucense]|uniref:nucleotidyltransferase family protein n=1 Tax=Laspinema olomoucense TaxID=3231600 RepID=UPI0021BB0A0C|nr:nucleotidyltransferase family protein [Laspinema sp. D3a]MCT7987565.1 nucleotidyltransferase family protein [Laspinema sp. D3a]
MIFNDLTPTLREQIKAIAAKHGAFNVRVFGSVARDEADQNSDLDLIVDYDLNKISPWFPVRLIHELENLLGVKVDVVTANGLKDRIRDQVLQESLTLNASATKWNSAKRKNSKKA